MKRYFLHNGIQMANAIVCGQEDSDEDNDHCAFCLKKHSHDSKEE